MNLFSLVTVLKRMKNKTPYRIDVLVEKHYVPEASDPEQDQYVFEYDIAIVNCGDVAVKLLGRRWWITNAEGDVYEVKGVGVVGEQPTIQPGEQYRYQSSAMIDTPIGTMQGTYEMQAADGSELEIDIPMFALFDPDKLH